METEEKAVVITHFISPYQFWYCDSNEESYTIVQDIEEELTSAYKVKCGGTLKITDIRVGNEIAVRYMPKNKFVRARIEEICRMMNSTKLIVWALDHGYPFETKLEYCRQLPENYNQKIDRIHYGGIMNIVPSSLEYDFLEQQTKVILADKWCNRACQSLSTLIEEGASVEFAESACKNGQYWGDLIVYDHRGDLSRASDYLVNEKVAVRSIKNFLTRILNLKPCIVPNWQTNDGNNNFKQNRCSAHNMYEFPADRQEVPINKRELQYAQRKVAAWSDFNRNAVKNADLHSSLGATSISASTIYGKVGDLVSEVNRSVAMNDKKSPPKSSLSDFGLTEDMVLKLQQHQQEVDGTLSECSKTNDDACSGVTALSRTNYERAVRAKLIQLRHKRSVEDPASYSGGEARNDMSTKLNYYTALRTIRNSNDQVESNGVAYPTSSTTSSVSQPLTYLSLIRRKKNVAQAACKESVVEQTGKDEAEALAKSMSEISVKTTYTRSTHKNDTPIFPAGYDLSNLNVYKNKEHWHRRPTTRNERHLGQDQDFQFTRANTDKRKEDVVEIRPRESESINQPPDKFLPSEKFTALEHENSEDAEGDEDGSSNASMHSALSNLNDVSYENKIPTPKQKTPNYIKAVHTAHTTEAGKQLLQNYIKAPSNTENKSSTNSPQPITQQTLVTAAFDTKATAPRETQFSNLRKENKFRRKYMDHTVLAHAAVQVTPIENFNQIALTNDVSESMLNRGFYRVSRTQAYSWPHLLNGNSLFIVSPRESCKTWCYIPPLCTAIKHCLERNLAPSTNGPLAIVLAASAKRAIGVADACSYLLRKQQQSNGKTICSFGVRELIQTKVLIMEGCGILVATLPNFRRLLTEQQEQNEPLFNPQRLRHIIIDDLDEILSHCKDDFEIVFKSLRAMAPKMKDNYNNQKLKPQLVVTSRSYLSIFKDLIKIAHQPLLIIGDFLEATFYGKAKICFEICAKSQKIARILEFIKEHPYKTERLIILCNNDEDLYFICEQLQLSGIESLGCHSNTNTYDREQVQKWKLLINHSKVLVCTDSVLYEFEIQNVKNLIHFSLSRDWTTMKFRFSVHKETYENLIKDDFKEVQADDNKNDRAISLILLDEENNYELPRIVDFLRTHDQLKYISKDVVKLSQHISMEREKDRCNQLENEFCDLFFDYGECDRNACSKRHMLNEKDFEVASDSNGVSKDLALIHHGDLRMLVLNVYSPTHYAVRLLEHRASNASAWRCIRQSDRAASFLMKLNFFYTKADNRVRHWPVHVSDICVMQRNGSYQRVRVLNTPKVKSENIVQKVDVILKLLDDGTILTDHSDILLICHEQFKNFPPQAINVRVLGLRPLDNEIAWDTDSKSYVKNMLIYKLKPNESVCASVSFSLVDTIAVRNVLVMEKLPTLGTHTINYNLKSDLISKQYAIIDQNAELRMFDIIKEFGFDRFLSGEAAESEVVDEGDEKNVSDNLESTLLNGCQTQEAGVKNSEKMPRNIKQDPKPKEPPNNSNYISIPQPNPVRNRCQFLRNLQAEYKSQEPTLAPLVAPKNSSIEKQPLPEACSFDEFFQIVRNVLAQEAEEEGNEELLQELEKLRNNPVSNAILAPTTDHSDASTKEQITEKLSHKLPATPPPEINEIGATDSLTLPPLKNLHKRPKTNWYQTNYFIVISIAAPELVDYELHVGQSFLYYAAKTSNESRNFVDNEDDVDEVLVLNFLGIIEPQSTSHELRGLQVIVRLQKIPFMKWPRLLKTTEKRPWLSYNLNMLNIEEMDEILPQHRFRAAGSCGNLSESDSNESDAELQTYVPIINQEDLHDPINDELF